MKREIVNVKMVIEVPDDHPMPSEKSYFGAFISAAVQTFSHMVVTECTVEKERKPEVMWDKFIQFYAGKNGFTDEDGKITMKNFIGGIEGYRKAFIEANKEK